ncbi:MAG: AAA family ATPase [Anaerolineales bacterium]|nr:AAA family ATPase [Anaerolineales bacterium]
MGSSDTLIRHAITPIEFDRAKMHRDRLVDMIHENLPCKLIAIGAPPGYGKTTILADFAAHTSLPVCWVRLSSVERDVFRLAEILAASLARRFRRLRGLPDLTGLAGATPEALARAFHEAIESTVEEPFVIAVDDVQHINHSRDVLRFLDIFIQELPEQVTVLAAGREILNISLAKLMAEGHLTGFGPHDLALDLDELDGLVNHVKKIDLSERQIERLYNHTRGWITGVLLSNKLGLAGLEAVIDSPIPLVYEYLVSVVLSQQSEDLREFLVESSVLPVMTSDSCDFVLHRTDSKQHLNLLMNRNMFISVTKDSPRMYEYHPQFREFLNDRLKEESPERFEQLRTSAAQFLEENGAVEHAIYLYVEAGNLSRAAKLAESNAQKMFYLGRYQTLIDWERRFPEQRISTPLVHLYLAKAYTDQGEVALAEDNLAAADRMLGDDSSSELRAKVENQKALLALQKRKYDQAWAISENVEKICTGPENIHSRASSMRIRAYSLLSQNKDLEKAEKLDLEAVQLLEDSDEKYDLALTYTDLAAIQLSMGKPLEAQRTSQKAHKILMEKGTLVPLAASCNNMAFYAHMRGDYEEAIQYYREGLKFARRGASPSREANILFGMADLFNDLGLTYQAGEHYSEGLKIATRIDNSYLISYGCLGTSMLHRRSGNGDLPHQWLQRAVNLGNFSDTPAIIRIQIAALEVYTAPSTARGSLAGVIAEEVQINAMERTQALYFYARSLLEDQQYHEAVEQFNALFNWACGNGTEQIVAAELLPDLKAQKFCQRYSREHSFYEIIFQRIANMKSYAGQFLSMDQQLIVDERLFIKVLGEVRLKWGDKLVEDLKPLDKEILVYILDRKKVERDIILEEFWPDSTPGKKVASLYTAVYSLRRVLGKESILLEDSIYSINTDYPYEYDVKRFERAANIAEQLMPGDPRRNFALTEAVSLYTGPFFPDSDSEWVLDRRRLIESRYLDLLMEQGEEALVRDQAARAVESFRQALAIDPYRDDINSRYLEALGRLERRSEIVAHYQQYVRLLSNDLGLDPPDSVRRLYTSLLG